MTTGQDEHVRLGVILRQFLRRLEPFVADPRARGGSHALHELRQFRLASNQQQPRVSAVVDQFVESGQQQVHPFAPDHLAAKNKRKRRTVLPLPAAR